MLDVDAILAQTDYLREAKDPGGRSRGTRSPPAADRRRAMALALGAAWPAKGRHEAQLALAARPARRRVGGRRGARLPLHGLPRCVDENRTKREATIRHTWSRLEGAALTGWTRLKSFVDPVLVDAARGAIGRDAEWNERTTRRLADVASTHRDSDTVTAPPISAPGDTIAAGPFVFKVGGLDAPQPPLVYTIDGLICKADVCMLVAHGGSMKTWLAFSLALAVTTGRPWLGRFASMRGWRGDPDFESG